MFRACGGVGASCDQGCKNIADVFEPSAFADAKSALKKTCKAAKNALAPKEDSSFLNCLRADRY